MTEEVKFIPGRLVLVIGKRRPGSDRCSPSRMAQPFWGKVPACLALWRQLLQPLTAAAIRAASALQSDSVCSCWPVVVW
jgi:hypothetical protein